MRETSKFNVAVLNLDKLKKELTASLKRSGKITDLQTIDTFKYGIVEKDEKHYLINYEGVGTGVAMEDEADDIYWFRSTYNEDGTEHSHDCGPFISTRYRYYELLKEVKIDRVITLDKFIKVFGSRNESNFYQWEGFLLGEIVLENA
jgi:hypothetical protein